MIDYSDFFIAVYTHECKSYCDVEFFQSLLESDAKASTIKVVDNSLGLDYYNRLQKLTGPDVDVHHLDIDRTDMATLFGRNVTESVNYLRDIFLASRCKYFVILESDVIPPQPWLSYFHEVIDRADIIGGIYYQGFHGQEMFDDPDIFQTAGHILSGCALYHRKVIEAIPFRYSIDENKDAFPDAWMSYDASLKGFALANYSRINCKHLSKPGTESRGLEDLK